VFSAVTCTNTSSLLTIAVRPAHHLYLGCEQIEEMPNRWLARTGPSVGVHRLVVVTARGRTGGTIWQLARDASRQPLGVSRSVNVEPGLR
jgi:hypothetical protein